MGRNKAKFKSKSKGGHNSWARSRSSSNFKASSNASNSHGDGSISRTCSSHSEDFQTGTNEGHGTAESDIPGYYYDPEKKTYFKILPYHLGQGGNFVTKESIKKGKSDTNPVSEKFGAKSDQAFSTLPYSKTKRTISSITHSINLGQIGKISGDVFKRHVMFHKYNTMQYFPSWSTSEVVLPKFGIGLEALMKMELNPTRNKAVCVWSKENEMSHRLQLMSISHKIKCKVVSENRGSFPVMMEPSQTLYITSPSNIGSICLSPLSSHPGTLCVLYTSVHDSKVYICNMEATEEHKVRIFDCSIGKGMIWSSAWNRVRNRFSVGTEKKCQVVDVLSRRQWVYSTGNSDALSQLFSEMNPNVLFSGTRSGFILIHDLRSVGSSQITTRLRQNSPVICIRSPRDGNYIFASDFSGSIYSWDLRMQKTVIEYSGLRNSHYFLPFYLDETENFIYGTGSDSLCKVWDVRTGNVVNTIACPHLDVSPDRPTLPITHISGHWAGSNGIVGAITGVGKRFFVSY